MIGDRSEINASQPSLAHLRAESIVRLQAQTLVVEGQII